MSNRDLIAETVRKFGVEAVIHFAGSAYVGESMQDPMKYFTNNTLGSMALLDAIMRTGVTRIVFSSTCVTYGVPNRVPIDETHPTLPVSPYGESKLAVEKSIRWLGTLKQLRWIALRYFNASGADPEGEIGETHDPETHLIPLALKAAAPGDYRLGIFGTDYPTPDGTAIRDYIHVTDLAHAHILALRALEKTPVNEPINLGTGIGASVKQVISAVEKVTGRKVRSEEAPRRAGDPPELFANAAKARSLLAWTPERSSLETIVEDAWRWYQKQSA
jgi:UDP-glucose-4-epimerase GalE